MSFWTLLLLCVLSFSLPTSAQQSSWSLLSFCYVTYNSLSTSPFLYWAFTTQGTLNLTTNSSGAAVVTDARGTRLGYYAGGVVDTSSITGVAPAGSYLSNSNLLSPSEPSAPLQGSSVLVFVTSSPAPFATGVRLLSQNQTGLTFVAVGADGELDNPPNDGEASVVNTLWQTGAATDGLSPNFTGCTLSVPPTIVNTPANVALYNSSGTAYQFCADISGGPGEGTTDGGSWNIQHSGTVQTSGWIGTTVSGRSASMVTSLNGTRFFVYENGTKLTTSTSLAPFTAALSALNSSLPYRDNVASNVIYVGWPQIDSRGWALQSSAAVAIEALANTQTTVVRLSINTTGELIETVLAGPNGVKYLDRTGTFFAQNVTGSSSSLTTLSQQCSIDYGAVSEYEFCYYIDNSALSSTNPQRGIVFAYGLFIAAGPQPQQGRQALRVEKITGVRYIQTMQNGNTSLLTQNLKHIKYLDQDGTLNQQNDNLIYTSSPALDQLGLLIETNGNGIFFSGTSGNTDVRLQQGPYGISEIDSDLNSATVATSETASGFFYQPVPVSGLGVTSQCSSYSTMFTTSNQPAPAIKVYSFCYGGSTPLYNVSVAAALSLYSTPINFLGRTGYAIAGINGTRLFTAASGRSSVNSIIGPSSDWYAKQINPYESYDQLFSTSASSEIVDVQGILYQFSGTADTPVGPSYQLQVIRLYWNATTSMYTEEVEVGVVSGIWDFSELPISQAVVVADGGTSAADGTVAITYCGVYSPSFVSSSSTAVLHPSSSTGHFTPSVNGAGASPRGPCCWLTAVLAAYSLLLLLGGELPGRLSDQPRS